ncbi:hypothetical protein C7212DRAFT_295822 [Tuber magnatum]|uniref:UBC core domain-containing protein n=1 Tax=Tuber magnatum TaxID=42249 RepID=A0A317SRR2_9PEZI|nr:hypothetical protein C7212DRAFT_295822 [Tuber magnatum]
MTPKPKRPHSPDEDSLDKPSLPPASGVTRGSSKARKRSKMDGTSASGKNKNIPQAQTDTQSFVAGTSSTHEKNTYKMNPKRASSSFSSGPSSRISSEITSPEDTGNPSEVDVDKLRNWWTALHSKGRCCSQCNNELHFESVTTDTLRNQLDSVYRIKNAVRSAEKAEKHRKEIEEKAREETISRLARWGRVKRLAGGNSPSTSKTELEMDKENIEDEEKEKENGNAQDGKIGKDSKGKGKEKEDKTNAKKLSQIFGTECCPKCRTYLCIACLKPAQPEPDQKWEDRNGAKNPDGNDTSPRTSERSFRDDRRLWCCSDGRLVAILLCLGIIDEEFLGLSANGNSLCSSSAGRGIKGTLRRSLRSLKDKITDGTHPTKPPVSKPERKARAKGTKDKGTGYGSGTYTASMFGFDTSDNMDWDFPEDESDFDDGPLMFSDLELPATDSGIGKLSEKIVAQVAALSGPPTAYAKPLGATHSPQAQPEPTPVPKVKPPPGLSTPEGLPLASASPHISPNQQFQPPPGPSTTEGVSLTSAFMQLPSEYPFKPSHGFPVVNGLPLDAPPPYSPSSAASKEPTNPGPPQMPMKYPYHGFGLGRGTNPLGGLSYSLPHAPPHPTIKTSIAPGHQYHPSFFQNPGKPLANSPGGPSSAKDPLPKPVVEGMPGLPIPPNAAGPPLSAPDMMQHIKSYVTQHPEAALSSLGYIPGYIPTGSDLEHANALFEAVGAPSGFTDDGAGVAHIWPGPPEAFQSRSAFKTQALPAHPPLSSKQIMHDKTLYAVIRTLIRLFSDSGSEIELQYVTSDVTLSMLRASMLAEKIEELLRNDSIQDISIHSEVYLALVALLNRLSDSPNLEFLVLENRRSKLFTSGIMKITQSKPVIDLLAEIGPKTRGKAAAAVEERKRAEVLMYEDGFSRHSMVQVMSKLSTQARVFLKCVGKTKGDEFEGTEAAKTLKICMEIVAIGEKLLNLASRNANNKNRPSFTSSRSIEGPPQMRAPPMVLVLDLGYHDGMAFEYIEGVVKTHYWNLQATSLATSPRGRVLHLSREMATMSTSLPQGVFVRVEDGRPDVIKAMIVGPCETPYEGGLYEFDIWAPANYPSGPPMCQFKTTGNGTVHFNPNLYNCGKVCLSILNTWSGASSERWQPGTSTLLQVFVSIQSMILCATPWYNEPGRREGTRKKDAEEFNGRVRVNSVKWAILDWLRDPSKRNGIWKDVIEAHFKTNKGYLLDLVKEWAKKDPRLTNSKANVGSNKWSSYEDTSGTAQNYVLALEEEFAKL